MHPLLIHVVFESHNLSGQKTTATLIYCTNLFVLCDIFIVVGRSTNWPHPTLWPCVHPDPIGSLPWNTTWRAYKLTGLWRKGHSLRFQDMSTSHLYSVGDLHGDDQSYQTILKALGLLSNDGTLDAVDQNPGLVPVLHGGWVVPDCETNSVGEWFFGITSFFHVECHIGGSFPFISLAEKLSKTEVHLFLFSDSLWLYRWFRLKIWWSYFLKEIHQLAEWTVEG